MSGVGHVAIASEAARALVQHARRERPWECCGLLVGRGSRVLFAVPMRNVAASPTSFRVDDAEHIALRRALRGFAPRLDIVGVYHSHPAGDVRPSDRDVREALYPDWVYVIVALRERARIAAFRIRHGRVQPLRVAAGRSRGGDRG
jgi:proteasome lid subunit RPN8/RPN11